MQDTYAGPAWQAPSQPRPRGARPRDDGNYRAPSFGGERVPEATRGPARGATRGAAWGPPPARTAAAPSSEPRAPRTRPMFSITCKSCGTEGQVPFKPIEGRDVFCQACYRARKPAPLP
jgi:CxxC-x17-CxxC domain-containing protein